MKICFGIVFILLFSGFSPIKQPDYSFSGEKVLPAKLPPHPRLFFPGGQENEILHKARENTLLANLIDILRKEADKKLLSEPQIYIPEVQLLKTSREEISRILTLSMAFRLFKDDKYARKVQGELMNVCKFPSWNPDHFLDVAEMTTAVAIGYDWCYDFLSPETRKFVEDAIRKNGFDPAWPIYEKTGKTPFNRENNWNMVCNSGMVNGALALADKYPEEAEKIIQYAVKYTPNLLQSFAPEGVFNEGPGYWSYNGMYMVLLFDNLFRLVKNDYGLSSCEGLENTASFYMRLAGPSGKVFNFGDASDDIDYSATFFFLSRQYKLPDVAGFYRDLLHSAIKEYNISGSFGFPRFFFLSIPWYDESFLTNEYQEKPLTIFNGVTDIMIFNGNSRSDTGRLYLAAKTGKPRWSHNQLDGGSFVLDCDGERWGVDLGPDSYSLPDFWDYQPGGVRWNYFRNTNMAHNTLSIDGKIASSDGQGEIYGFNQDDLQPWGILDLTRYYPDQAVKVLRGFRLLAPKAILVQDEVKLRTENRNISWRFFTEASVMINGNTAVLSLNGKNFFIRCLLPAGYEMKVIQAKPYSSAEKPIKGVSIIEISVDSAGKFVTVPVIMSNQKEVLNDKYETFALKDWK